MSRGLGNVERRILEAFQQTGIGLDVSALTEAIPEVSVRGVRRAVQRLERSGQLTATFQPVPHAQQWGGISRVKVVSLVHPKVDIQDGGATYTAPDRPYERRHYLDRGRKHWQRLAQHGYVLLPGVRKKDVYEALGAVIHWQQEEQHRHWLYANAWQSEPYYPRDRATLTPEHIREKKAVWQQAQDLLDQARAQLTTLIKAPHIDQASQESSEASRLNGI
jgi:hypothetical protein